MQTKIKGHKMAQKTIITYIYVLNTWWVKIKYVKD